MGKFQLKIKTTFTLERRSMILNYIKLSSLRLIPKIS